MALNAKISVIDRRTFLVAAGASAALSALIGTAAAGTSPELPVPAATAASTTRTTQFNDALQKILGAAEATADVLTLELPELAENGNTVPYKLSVENPMTDTDYIKTMYLLSTSNPQALVGTFHLIPATGKAAVSGRMRLARTQDVVAVAEKSDGTFLIATRKVDVTIGGCGNE